MIRAKEEGRPRTEVKKKGREIREKGGRHMFGGGGGGGGLGEERVGGCVVFSQTFIQIPPHTVALNYQTEGRPLDFNDGRFRANGGSGYILKPDYMRQGRCTFT